MLQRGAGAGAPPAAPLPHPQQPHRVAAWPHAHQAPRRRVAVYRGEGAGWRSVQSTVASLRRLLPPACYEVGTIAPGELLAGGWQAGCALLVMPGGADLPYCRALNGPGNTLISDFVRSGGAYLGICAGAYYACAAVEFEPGGPMAVVGPRELAFFPGTARGAVVPGFDYQTEAGAAAVRVRFLTKDAFLRRASSSSSGGSSSGSPEDWVDAVDYCNGGPFFVAPDGATDWGWTGVSGAAAAIGGGGAPSGVQVLARYVGLPPGRLARVAPGGNGSGAAMAVAAVRCAVGAGAAVLCGTHPELAPSWLDACGLTPPRAAVEAEAAAAAAAAGGGGAATAGGAAGPSAAARSSSGSSSGDAGSSGGGSGAACPDAALARHTEEMRAALEGSQAGRDELLRTLLAAALMHQQQPAAGPGGAATDPKSTGAGLTAI